MVNLDSFNGSFGVVTDRSFDNITSALEHAEIVSDNEVDGGVLGWSELVVTTYRVGSKLYELWYQTRTPFSPKFMQCSFGFNEI